MQGAERIKGYSPDEIIGEHFSRFYTPEDFEVGVPTRALETARETGRYEAEGWRVRKDGTRFWASVVIDAIRDEDGRADRLRQDHAGHDRQARDAVAARRIARATVPLAEDGGARPADRRASLTISTIC